MHAATAHLTRTHSKLEEQIRSEMKKVFPDSGRLHQLKKLKLAIKDRIDLTPLA